MFGDAERGSSRMSCRERVGENEVRKEHEERSDDTEKITTKSKTNPTPIFEEVLPRLGSQNDGIPTCLQGKTASEWERYRRMKKGDER